MRIRKRPPPPPPPQIQTDASLQPPVSNGREEAKAQRRAGGGLHPDGDPPIGLHGRWMRDSTLTQFLQPQNASDPHPTIGIPSSPASQPNGCCISPPHSNHVQVQQVLQEEVEEKQLQPVDLHNSNKRISSSSSSSDARLSTGTGGNGCKGKKTLPLKRGWYHEIEDEKPVGKAKATASPRAYTSIGIRSINCESCDDVVVKELERNGKKRRSPAVLMEGSRCSRVNGRGWRCCQQTLVGYSLCEHHLGKGRLRSMNSVRAQAGGSKPNKVAVLSLPMEQQQFFDVGDEELERPSKKGSKKIGTVKARSINSLLDDQHAQY